MHPNSPTLTQRSRLALGTFGLIAICAGATLGCGGDPPPLAVQPTPSGGGAQATAPTPVAAPDVAPPSFTAPAFAPASPAAPGGPVAASAPRVIAFDPPQGAVDVDPERTWLSVTFDQPMEPQGWSWVTEGAGNAPEIGEASFDASARTNAVEARLAPGRTYVVWINSDRWSYFRSANGIPATPVRWVFSTRGAPDRPVAVTAGGTAPSADAPAPAGRAPDMNGPRQSAPSAAPAPGSFGLIGSRAAAGAPAIAPPRVVAVDPPNGARDVDPATTVLRATYDRPMSASWSWVREDTGFPETTGRAYFEADQRTAALPVRLAAGEHYVLWLNRPPHAYFTDLAGTAAEPYRWEFWTRGDASRPAPGTPAAPEGNQP